MRAIVIVFTVALIGLMIGSTAHAYEPPLPSGAIVAFDLEECPDGWEEFKPADGRFLVGVGRLIEDDPRFVFQLGDSGGTAMHRHFERAERAELAEGTGDGSNVHRDPSASEPAHHRHFQTNRVDHYPPYVGVRFCKRQ